MNESSSEEQNDHLIQEISSLKAVIDSQNAEILRLEEAIKSDKRNSQSRIIALTSQITKERLEKSQAFKFQELQHLEIEKMARINQKNELNFMALKEKVGSLQAENNHLKQHLKAHSQVVTCTDRLAEKLDSLKSALKFTDYSLTANKMVFIDKYSKVKKIFKDLKSYQTFEDFLDQEQRGGNQRTGRSLSPKVSLKSLIEGVSVANWKPKKLEDSMRKVIDKFAEIVKISDSVFFKVEDILTRQMMDDCNPSLLISNNPIR